MIPFRVQFQSGVPAGRQVVFAGTKAIVSGVMRPGDRFPSVRELSQAFKINPNTAHKVVAELTRSGLLEMRPGIGAFVTHAPRASAADKAELLGQEIERLAVEAKRLGLDLDDLLGAVERHWRSLTPPREVKPKP